MTMLIFVGDMLVMLFMTCLVVWVTVYVKDEQVDSAARIPLEDE